jgi:hypothetical protein
MNTTDFCFLKYIVCKDVGTLEITNIVHEHNHEVSKAAFNHLFHQSSLDSGQKNEIRIFVFLNILFLDIYYCDTIKFKEKKYT